MKKYYYKLKSNQKTLFSFLLAYRKFKTRSDALNYMFDRLPANSELEYENVISKHNIEYICTDHSRFSIERCMN